MPKDMDKLRIFDAGPDQELSDSVCKILGIRKSYAEKVHFKDGDISWNIDEKLRGTNVFIFQSYVGNKAERLYELELLINGIYSGACDKITVVMPFMFGSRAERMTKPKQPINSVVIAKQMHSLGVDGILTMNIHTRTIGSFYSTLQMYFDNLEFEPLIAYHYSSLAKKDFGKNFGINSPDTGGAERARHLLDIMTENFNLNPSNSYFSIIDKRRKVANDVEIHHVIGDVEGKDIIMIDDIGDTLNTMIKGATALKEKGKARSIYIAYPHGVHSGDAGERLYKAMENGIINEALISDTIPQPEIIKKNPNVKIITVAPLFAEAIKQIHIEGTTKPLHNYKPVVELYKKYGIFK